MVDLHIHSIGSDGIYSVDELTLIAKEAGVDVLSLTDHDSISGIEKILSDTSADSITVIPGIEFSCHFIPGDYHLLGYGIDHRNEQLVSTLEFYSQQRRERIEAMIEKLNAIGLKISKEDIVASGLTDSPGKPHIARALIKKGYVKSVSEAFELYLGRNGVADVPKQKITREEAYRLIALCGGCAVLAHPASLRLKDSDLETIIKEDISRGLCGLEVFAQMHSEEQVLKFRELAERYGLFLSGGSDFHGDKEETMGCYGSNRVVPVDAVAPLINYLKTL
ncbi:MAG: PHP domain-containing protein [Spirochaetes bacterium]|jgi:predicted metal-dependent phosphoesterase TrpH|nr:PHP domain-containing protein [Spirochaetota bacterium]